MRQLQLLLLLSLQVRRSTSPQQTVKWKLSQLEMVSGHAQLGVLAGFGRIAAPRIVFKSPVDVTDSPPSSNRCVRMLVRWWTSLSMKMIYQLCQQPLAAFTHKQSGRPRHHLPIMPLPQSSLMPQALRLAAQAQYLKVCTHRGQVALLAQPQRMTTDQVCQVQQERTQARPCPDSHLAVSSTPHAEGPLLVTCP